MRDPNRIDPMLELLAQVWKQNPDWRLGQLIENCAPANPYYVEDDTLADELRQFLK